jgi:UDP-glucose 4-epimerase
MEKLNIGIFGSNGFIGNNLSIALINTFNFNKLYLFSRSINPSISRLISEYPEKIIHISIDILDPDSYKNQIKELDVIYYLISNSIPLTTWDSSKEEFNKNILPFIDLLESLHQSKIKRFIYASSAGTVYGNSKKIKNESSVPSPYSPYGIGKLTMEYLIEFYANKLNFKHTTYRISNVYGPGQNTNSGLGFINKLIENIAKNISTPIYGNTIRNYVFIDDVIKIFINSLNNIDDNSTIINLASCDNLSTNEVLSIVGETLNTKIKTIVYPKRMSDNPKIIVSNKKLLKNNKNLQFTSISEGILKTFNYINEFSE